MIRTSKYRQRMQNIDFIQKELRFMQICLVHANWRNRLRGAVNLNSNCGCNGCVKKRQYHDAAGGQRFTSRSCTCSRFPCTAAPAGDGLNVSKNNANHTMRPVSSESRRTSHVEDLLYDANDNRQDYDGDKKGEKHLQSKGVKKSAQGHNHVLEALGERGWDRK
jgi:hypothetical protein